MTDNTKSFESKNRPDLEIHYRTRDVLSDPNLTEHQRNHLSKMEFLTSLLFLSFLIGIPAICIKALTVSKTSFDKMVFSIIIIYFIFGSIGLICMSGTYPYRKGFVGLSNMDIRFRKDSFFPAFYSPIIKLKFTEIKSIYFKENEYIIKFELLDFREENLTTMGMKRSEKDTIIQFLKQLPRIKFKQT